MYTRDNKCSSSAVQSNKSNATKILTASILEARGYIKFLFKKSIFVEK